MSLIGNISSASSVSLDGYTAGGALNGTYPNPSINLTGNSSITGVLPTSKQASQTVGGDLSGTTAAATLIGIDGYSLPNPGAYTGVLTSTAGTLTWTAPTTYVSLAGDLGNTLSVPEVISITGPSGGVLPVGTSANPLTQTSCTITDAYTINTLYNALQTNSNTATTIHTIAVASNTTIFVNVSVLGVDGYNDGYICSATLSFTATRQTNFSSGTLTLVPATPTPNYITNLSGSSMSVSASVSSNNIIIQVTGISGKTCRWQSAAQVQEVS